MEQIVNKIKENLYKYIYIYIYKDSYIMLEWKEIN